MGQQARFGKVVRHGVRQFPDLVAGFIGEVEVGWGEGIGIAIGPVGVEIRMRVAWAAGVAVIAGAVRGDGPLLLPGDAVVFADPRCHFSSRAPWLRALGGGADDLPGCVVFREERASIVVVRGGGDVVEAPCRAGPAGNVPGAWSGIGPRLVVAGGEVENDRVTGGIDGGVVDVHVLFLCRVIADAGGAIDFRQRDGDFFPGGGGPSPAHVVALHEIEVGTAIDVALRVAIEGGEDTAVHAFAGLVVAFQSGEFLFLAPCDAVRAGAEIQLAPGRVAGVGVEKSLARDPPRLGVGELRVPPVFPRADVVRAQAAVDAAEARFAAATDKHPQVPLLVDGQRGVVVRVIDGGLVHHDDGSYNCAGLVIVVGNGDLQQSFVGRGCGTPGEVGAFRGGMVDGHGHVIGGVGAEAAGIFIAVGGLLPECEPDAAKARGGGRVSGDGGGPQGWYQQQAPEEYQEISHVPIRSAMEKMCRVLSV